MDWHALTEWGLLQACVSSVALAMFLPDEPWDADAKKLWLVAGVCCFAGAAWILWTLLRG